MITDKDLIACIAGCPDGARFAWLCQMFNVPYDERDKYGVQSYTPEARALGRQLQRLRKTGLIDTTQGQRWEVREG